ncbi:hypothetical protein ACNKHO_17765 [Shigella flexneri]
MRPFQLSRFLWITWCKILFIVSDQNWKTFSLHSFSSW